MRPRYWRLRVFRCASPPATCRMAPPSRCSCCRWWLALASACCGSSGGGRSDMKRLLGNTFQEISFYGAVALFVIMTAFPFYWMLITSLKSNPDLYNVTNIPFWFNEAPTLEHYRYLFERTLFTRWLLNSLVIGLCVVAITLVAALPAGYSLARMTGRGGEALGIGIFLTYLVPPTLLFLPLSRIVADLGL